VLNINKKYITYFCFCMVLSLNIAFWTYSNNMRAMWSNVPPVPTIEGAKIMTLGDGQFFYRMSGIMLQNLGDLGGQSTRMSLYNYPMLGEWFSLVDALDEKSNFFPMLAAYYYGPTGEAEDLRPVIDYLTKVGMRPEGEKWRWLAQAIYLARYKHNDINLALELAQILAEHPNTNRPGWSYQMPAFILNAKGDKEAAVGILTRLLIDEVDNMHPVEVSFMVDYICNRLLDEDEKKMHPLCIVPADDTE